MQRTHIGVVLLVVSMLAVGPLQLWKAGHRAQLAAQLGCTGPASRVPPATRLLLPLATLRPVPSFTPGPPAPPSLLRPEPQVVNSVRHNSCLGAREPHIR